MKTTRINKLTTIHLILWIFISFNTMACAATPYQGTKERKLPAFNELNLSISADVILTQGPVQKVEIMASERLLNLIETDVKNGALTIKWTERFVNHTENVKIYITMVDINALRISGSGDINADGDISSSNIELKISGSGNIRLNNLKAENISSIISGSADISIGGSNAANSLEVSISGSGDVKAPDLPVKNVEINLSGSGNCRVNALETIKARVSGSGDIYYKGTATVDARVSGSGSVQHVN